MARQINICFLILNIFLLSSSVTDSATTVINNTCIIGSGIGGSSVAHFLRKYSSTSNISLQNIHIFERHDVVGGRMAMVSVGGEMFEAGASVLHPSHLHAVNFVKYLNLSSTEPSSFFVESSFGIWDGSKFLFKTIDSNSESFLYRIIISGWNWFRVFLRYGFSVFRLMEFVQEGVDGFLKYYAGFESRPGFETVEEMLKWAGLYELTARTLNEKLVDAGLSSCLISELVTIITRVSYGQGVSMSGLAGAVALTGLDNGLWSVKGGNWQMAAGLIEHSNVTLHLEEEIGSITSIGSYYELNSTKGNSYICEVAVVATPLDEVNIRFSPPISIPDRKWMHTHATFVRGILNPVYFSVSSVSEIPAFVGTIEADGVPFSSITVLKRHGEDDMTYKIFSATAMEEFLLDEVFSVRKDTARINWSAYPKYTAPEIFAPFLLDGSHLYYLNTIENVGSIMEASAIAAENVARLILSRYSKETGSVLETSAPDEKESHVDV